MTEVDTEAPSTEAEACRPTVLRSKDPEGVRPGDVGAVRGLPGTGTARSISSGRSSTFLCRRSGELVATHRFVTRVLKRSVPVMTRWRRPGM
jgi:hypothetical protein